MTTQKSMKKQKLFSHKIIKTSDNPEETFNVAKEIAQKTEGPFLVGLDGELGVGKTIFAKGFAEGLEVKELITSPTFLGISESYSGRSPFIHMDFYKKVVPLEKINFYLAKNSVVLIEWYENYFKVFQNELLEADLRVYIHYSKDKDDNIANTARQIVIS